jgi:zinc transporter 9
MAGDGSKASVNTAIAVNLAIALVKFVAFFVSGSGAMLAESLHSTADLGNQALLGVGMRKAARPADLDHPLGYGSEAFVWSLISAVGMFFLGSGVSIQHGISALMHPESHGVATHDALNFAVLGVSIAGEALSFSVAFRGVLGDARTRGQTLVEYFRKTDDPFGVAVLLEDSAALVGLLLALGSVGLTAATGVEQWDDWGTIAIGLLLGVLAMFLTRKNSSLLNLRSVGPGERQRLFDALAAAPSVASVVRANAVVVGPDSVAVTAKVVFRGSFLAEQWLAGRDPNPLCGRAHSVEGLHLLLAEAGGGLSEVIAAEIDALEDRVRQVIPRAIRIDVEVGRSPAAE